MWAGARNYKNHQPTIDPNIYRGLGWLPPLQASMSLLNLRRCRELIISYCLLIWAGQRAPGYLSPVQDLPLARLLSRPHTGFFVPGEFRGPERTEGVSSARWFSTSTKDQTAPDGASLLCRALRLTTEISDGRWRFQTEIPAVHIQFANVLEAQMACEKRKKKTSSRSSGGRSIISESRRRSCLGIGDSRCHESPCSIPRSRRSRSPLRVFPFRDVGEGRASLEG